MFIATSKQDSAFPPKGYIVGAPKCGTTALAHYLAQHPQVAFSKPKEPHHFATDLPGLRRSTTLEEYCAFFTPNAQSRMLIEASVWYLFSRTAAEEIMKMRPDARFIIMLRNPVKMLPSLHRQLVNAFDEDVGDFSAAWRLSAERAAGRSIPKRCRAPSTLVYTETAAFAAMLRRFWQVVPREQTLVMFQEDMNADTGRTYRRALDFFGLKDDARAEFPRINEAKRARSRLVSYAISRGGPFRELASKPLKRALGLKSLGIMKGLKRANAAPVIADPVSDALAAEIAAHYAQDLAQLADMLGPEIPEGFFPEQRPQHQQITSQPLASAVRELG